MDRPMFSRPLYIVGGYDENGNFTHWATRYDIGITDDLDIAEKILTTAVATSNGWIKDVQIWKLDPLKLELVNRDNGIKDYERLRKGCGFDSFHWLSEDLKQQLFVWVDWFYHRNKKTITIAFKYDRLWGADTVNKYGKDFDDALYNQAQYVMVPKIKEVLKKHNITSIKVEIKNNQTNRKLIRGFITKED